ncbi:beta strand repeat-containing protein, partial [Pedobacter sp. 22163]|uniref:beta strand repeat-containing protein n=1 Tax=Pedobacter sp. 22163 TaxID=3453883 RepID=UPI003F87DF1E
MNTHLPKRIAAAIDWVCFFVPYFKRSALMKTAMLLILFAFSISNTFADGSRDLYPSNASGGRAKLRSSTVSSASYPFPGLNAHFTYAKAGELITMASSEMGTGSAAIRLTAPDGTVSNFTGNTNGLIANRTAELAGPRLPGVAGGNFYTPVYYAVPNGGTGVYKVEFIAGGGVNNSTTNGRQDIAATAAWANNGTNTPLISAWDVSVFSSNSATASYIPGRVYANILTLDINVENSFPTNRNFFGVMYVLTKDGYTYRTNNNGNNGISFTFFVNNKGLVDASDQPKYKSVNTTTGIASQIQDPRTADTQSSITHKMFYKLPSNDLPVSAPGAVPGGSTWLKNARLNPEVTDLDIIGTDGTVGQVSNKGGKVVFTANLAGRYSIKIISKKSVGDPLYFPTRTLTGTALAGANSVEWDGKDGAGVALPNGSIPATLTVQLQGAEVHFPYFDMEVNPNGLILDLLATDNSSVQSNIVYWNDADIPVKDVASNPINASQTAIPSGTSSTTNGHKWGAVNSPTSNTFGDNMSMDTWTFVLGAEETLDLQVEVKTADLEVVGITPSASTIAANGTINYTVVARNNGPSDVTGAPFAFNVPTGYEITGVVPSSACATESSNTISADKLKYNSNLTLANGCSISYVVTVKAIPSVAAGSVLNVGATILRPNDVTDPDATNTLANVPPTDPQFECSNNGKGGACNNIKANTTVQVVNTPPVASPDQGTVIEDGTLNVPAASGLLSNDTDIDGNTLAVTKFTIGATDYPLNTATVIPGVGTITINGNGSYIFQPVADFNGAVPVISYSITDGNGGISTSTLSITVTPVNDVPVVAAISKSGAEDTPIPFAAVDFTSKFTDKDNNPLTKIRIVDLPLNGTLQLNGVAITVGQEIIAADLDKITFVPNADWNGSTSFNWNGSDGTAYAVSNAPVNITVTPVNDVPVIAAISKSGAEDTPIPFAAVDFTSKFTDKDNNPLTKIRIVDLPLNGTLQLNGVAITVGQEIIAADLDKITFVPNADWNGSTSFNWNGSDGTAYAVSNAPVNITVTPVNDVPVVAAISKSGAEDTPIPFAAVDFTSKFIDKDNNPLTKIRIVDLPLNGTLQANGVAITVGQEIIAADLDKITFVPNADWNGSTSFNWNGSDGTAYAVSNAPVNITVTPVNDVPVVAAISKSGAEDTPIPFAAVDFTSKFTDKDNNPLTKIRIVDLPLNGILQLNGVAITVGQEIIAADLDKITFVPNADWNGSTSFNWNGSDGTAYAVSNAPVNITVTPVNDVPVVAAISKSGVEDTPIPFAAVDFTSKFTDKDNNPLTKIRIVDLPLNGTLQLNGVAITAGQEIIAADLDKITFIPNADWNGSTSFNWNGSDGTAYAVSNAPVNITVTPVNDVPVVAAISKSGAEDIPIPFAAIDFTSKFTDKDNNPLTKIRIVDLPLNGTLQLNGVAITVGQEIIAADLDKITFVPNADWNGSTSFNWNGSDGTAYAVSNAPVNITVTPVNDVPVVAAISKSGVEDTPIPFAAVDFNSKFTDKDNNPLTKIRIVDLPLNGTLQLNGVAITAGQEIIAADLDKITFVPNADWNGSTSFNWNGSDGTAYAVSNAPVNITVTPVNDVPVVAAISKSGAEDTPIPFAAVDFTSKFTDKDNNPLTKIRIVDLPLNGTLQLNGVAITAGQEIIAADLDKITFVPNADWNGSTSFNWNGSDGTAYAVSNAPVNITVTPVNDVPVAVANTNTTLEDTNLNVSDGATGVTGDILINDTDVEGNTLTVTNYSIFGVTGTQTIGTPVVITGVGTITINANGSYAFQPAANYNGTVPLITYNISDGNGGNAASTLAITVTPVNDIPSFTKGADQTIAINSPAQTITPWATAISSGPTDESAQTLSFVVTNDKNSLFTTQPAISSTGVLTYTPAAGQYGKTTVTVYVQDNGGTTNGGVDQSATQTFVISIKPVGTTDTDTTPVNTATTTIVTANDGPSGVGTSVIPGGTSPGNGTITINPDKSITYTPNNGYVGNDTYTYILETPDGVKSDPITVNITVYNPKISLAKEGHYNDFNGNGKVDAGDRINYTFVVTNTGNVTLTNVTVTDANATISGGPIASLAVGASDNSTFTGFHTLTQAEIDNGGVFNVATATGKDPKNNNITTTSVDPTPLSPTDPNYPVTPPTPACPSCTVTPIVHTGAMTLAKDGTYNDFNTNGKVDAGDRINYTFVVTNTGNVTLTNVTVTDAN